MKSAAYLLCPYLYPKENTVVQKIIFFTAPQAPPKTHTSYAYLHSHLPKEGF